MRHPVTYLCTFLCFFGRRNIDARVNQFQPRKAMPMAPSLASFSLPGITDLSQGKLVGSVVSPPTDYRLKFFIKITRSMSSSYSNVIHFTTGGDYGDGYRVPAIWVRRDNRLHVAFGDIADHNHVWDSNALELGVETEVELVVVGRKAELFLDGVLFAVRNIRARTQLDEVKVYLSDPWYNPAAAVVRDIVYEAVEASHHYYSSFSLPGSVELKRRQIVAEISHPPKDYELQFKITPTERTRFWGNIIRFTTGGNGHYYGTRVPCIWIRGGSTRLYVASGHINNWDEHWIQPEPGLPLNVETEFKLSVVNQKAYIYLNSKLEHKFDVGPRPALEDVKVFMSDPWDEPASATLSNITFGPVAEEDSANLLVNISSSTRSGDSGEGFLSSDQFSYGGDQDIGGNALLVSNDGSTVTMEGNLWRALLSSSPIIITSDTVMEFDFKLIEEAEIQAICLDEDLDVGPDLRCFVVAGSQGGADDMYDLSEQTSEGDTENHYVIPIGHYYTGSMKYLVFVQDNDRHPTKGKSEFSNIQFYEQVRFPLVVTVHDTANSLPSDSQVEYGEVQDHANNFLSMSEDGSSLHMEGNLYKALPLSVNITENTVLDFDFELEENAEFTAICLDEDLALLPGIRCFMITTPSATTGLNYIYKVAKVTTVGMGYQHYRIPVGRYFSGEMNYIAFVQDNDADKLHGSSTFKNISFSEPPGLEIKVNGEKKTLPNQFSYGGNEDELSHMVGVSEIDKSSGQLLGNTWKALEFPEPITVTESTIIVFEFDLQDEVDIHAICLDEDLENDFGDESIQRCLYLAGRQHINEKYRVLERTSLSEKRSYTIKIGAFFTGEMKYLGFVQDNDEEPFLAGASSFSNIEIFDGVSCLQNTNFDFDFSECTLDNFLNGIKTELDTNHPTCINDATVELVTLFGVADQAEVTEKVGDVCAQAYAANHFSFDQITLDEYQFDEEFFDGGTAWNYEKQTVQDGENTKVLSEDAVMVRVRNADIAKTRGISWPTMHNFGFGKCEVPAAMCCWVADRQANDDGGTCSSEGCNDADPDDNSDLCYVDFTRFRQSAHVHDGYSIYGNGAEGNLNCHGFAWDNFSGSSQNALKGNLLFEVSMNMGLIEHGYVEQVPGAPMCGCVESMPVVSRADCTELEVNQYINVRYRGKYERFTAKVNITNISYSPCSGKTSNDFSSYFRSLVDAGKATVVQEVKFNQQIVGAEKCGTAIGDFLMNKGFSSGFYQGKTYLPASNVVMGPYLYASEIDLFTDGTPDANVWYKTPHGDIFNKNDNYYVDLDLGEVFDISRIVVWHYYHDQRRYFSQTVEISMDGLSFETVWETGIGRLGAVETVAGNSIDLYKPISGRYVRHRCGHNTRNHGVHFVEMAVYA